MALHREIEGAARLPAQPVERSDGRHLPRRAETSWQLATGTLACPACDAPVLPALEGMAPGDRLSCAYCAHAGAVRDFLSLAEPTRPTRVIVRVHGLALR